MAKSGSPLSRIQELYAFMVKERLETLEYDQKGLRVRLVRRRSAPVLVPVPHSSARASQPEDAGQEARGPHASPQGPQAPALPAGSQMLKAPMMGIFYRASSPSSPPFVKKGDRVKKGQVLCLIEAMKVFNEVKAEFDCTILDIALENGKPVKAGQDILLVQRT